MNKQNNNNVQVKTQCIASQQPKLRFPEFKGEWEENSLGKLTFKVGKKNKKGIKFPVYSINNKEGFLPQSEQFEGVDSKRRGYDITLYKIIEKNTFAYNPARINVGSIGYSGNLYNIIISSLYVCFKTTEQLDDFYLSHFLETNDFNKSVNNNVEGGIRNYLFYENFSRIIIPIPPSLPEQQKIASCLSSIDERIEAENQKLQALKQHKKGLMQNLFPQQGKTRPELRFKEFEGEWEEKKMNKLYEFKTTNSFSRDKLNYEDGTVKNIHYGDIHTKFSTLFDVKKEIVPFINVTEDIDKIKVENYCIEADIIFADASEDMDDVGKSIEVTNINNEKLVSGLHTILARQINDNLIVGFGGYLFKSNKIRAQIQREAQGTKVLSISMGRLSNIEIAYPKDKEEQQKIASCLSSLDEIIELQGKKIEKLKAHKKGLMQQMFPNPE